MPGFHDIVQGLERLFDRRLVIPAMDLIEIDIIHAEPAEAVVDLGHDRLARKALAIGVLPHLPVDLGGQDKLIAPGKIPQGPAE